MEPAGTSSSSSQSAAKKEWRAVSERTFGNNGTEDAEHGKLGQSDERTIYEEGMRPLAVDYCSITINDGDDDALRQRLQGVTRRREALQQMEIELRAQAIARSEIAEVQASFEAQIKEHSNATSKLKEQLDEKERQILDLRMELEDKERQLHALKIDSETAWAKEDLLREQNKELVTFRRERDNVEAERTQHLKQIHELQEHIGEKESQFLQMEEQHRMAQETILFKDDQLKEAQAWISHVQEMDVLKSSTLHAELRECTEQFTQYWMAFQQQYVIMERHLMQTIQQLQLELNEANNTNGIHKNSGQVMNENSSDSSSYVQNNTNHINVNDAVKSHGSLGFISNGNADETSLYASASNQSVKAIHDVPTGPTSVIGMGTFLTSQMAMLHPYMMNPQGIQQSLDSNSPIPQSLLAHFQSLSTNPGQNQWHAQQTTEVSQVNQSTYQSSQSEQDLLRTDPRYGFGLSSENQMVHQYLNSHGGQPRSSSVANGVSEEVQVFKSIVKNSISNEKQETPPVSSLHCDLEFNSAEQKSELKDDYILASKNQSQEQVLTSGRQWSTQDVILSSSQSQTVKSTGAGECNLNDVKSPEVSVTIAQVPESLLPGKPMDPNLLDERSLLSCIVRAIPAGSDRKIRISTTLSNRLAKMIAPLHWHDYKKHFGKLDDFVARHPELFVIEGDSIHLRDGAQEIISATTAAAKVAAAASSATYSSLLPSVAVTPIAQINRQKRPQLVESRAANSISLTDGVSVTNSRNSCDIPQISTRHDQQQNDVSFNIIQGVVDEAISNKQKNNREINALSSVTRPVNLSAQLTVRETSIFNNTGLSSSQIKELSNGRHYVGGKQQASSSGAGLIARR